MGQNKGEISVKQLCSGLVSQPAFMESLKAKTFSASHQPVKVWLDAVGL